MVSGDADACRTAGDIRHYLLQQLNSALRRPGMFGGEIALSYPKTLAYATGQAGSPLIFLHLWNGTQPGKAVTWPPEHPEPILLAARHGGARFIDGFIFTPTGSVRRSRRTS